MTHEERYAVVIKELVRNRLMIDALFELTEDAVLLLEKRLERCTVPNCGKAATVAHSDVGFVVCDRHASEMIVAARKKNKRTIECISERLESGDVSDADDLLVMASLADEDRWVDVEHASCIRALSSFSSRVNFTQDG